MRSPEEKLRIVLAVVRGELSVAEASRRERVSETSIAKWRDLFVEGGRRALVHGAGAAESAEEIALRDENEELKTALGEAFAELRVLRKGGAYRVSLEELEVIRVEHGLSVTRFCELVGLPRASYYRRRRREVGPSRARGPWPTPVLDRIDPLVAEVASSFGFFGYRKVWGRLRLDGQAGISASSVRRSMGRQGLLQPRRYQAERRALAQARKAVFVTQPRRRNRLWQLDWSELETLAGGSWNYAAVVDYWAKVALVAYASPTKTTTDTILAIEAAIGELERLLGRTLREECVDPETGELEPLVLVSDNGACFRSGGFQRFIDSRPELVHVRTRVKAPETNGALERWIESSKYERLYREEIADGLALQAQLDDYRDFYNTVRPHETLGQTLPISRYLAQPDNNETEEANLEQARSVSKS